MKSLLRVAQIGAGGFGYRHMACLNSSQGRRFFNYRAAADPAFASNASLRETLEREGHRAYKDFELMLDQEHDLDAVTIAAPIHLHEPIIRECLSRGLYIFLEKPPVPLLEQLRQLQSLPGQERVAVGFQWIASHPVQLAKRWIREQRIGKLKSLMALAAWPRRDDYYLRNNWAGSMEHEGAPVLDGPATNALAHLIHNMMYLGESATDGFTSPRHSEGEFYRVRPTIDSYDLVCLRGELLSGPLYHAALSHACRQEIPFSILVSGTRGWLRIGHDGCLLESSWGERHEYPHEIDEVYDFAFEDFALFCLGRRSRPFSTLADTAGYLMATSETLQASPGIRPVDQAWTQQYEENGMTGYTLSDHTDFLTEASRTAKLFSELNLPWAMERKGSPHISSLSR
jgi:predicted dehydrogenase